MPAGKCCGKSRPQLQLPDPPHLRICVLHDVEHGAARYVGLNHPQVLFVHKGHVQHKNVGMIEQSHGLRLLHDVILHSFPGLNSI